jgi:hypothetical protein
VDIVATAIIAGAHDDHGFELGRPARGELQTVKAAPRRADHTDRAIAPLRAGDPTEQFHAIILRLGEILLGQ